MSDDIRTLLESLDNIAEGRKFTSANAMLASLMSKLKTFAHHANQGVLSSKDMIMLLNEIVDEYGESSFDLGEAEETPNRGHGSPYDRGAADAYYRRWNPPKDPAERKEYSKGYNSEDERKDWGR